MRKFLKDTKYILLIFILLTIVTLISNFEHDSAKQVDARPHQLISQEIEVAAKKSLPANRSPASVVVNDTLKLKKDLFCNLEHGKKQSLSHASSHLVLEFNLCAMPQKYSELNISNETNGYKAQSFKLTDRLFKTDYIQLSNGQNKIKMELVLKDGQKLTEWLEILSGT